MEWKKTGRKGLKYSLKINENVRKYRKSMKRNKRNINERKVEGKT